MKNQECQIHIFFQSERHNKANQPTRQRRARLISGVILEKTRLAPESRNLGLNP